MTAIVQVTYQYGGGMAGSQPGRSSSSAMAMAEVPAGGKKLETAYITLGGSNPYVDGMATLKDFQYTKTVHKIKIDNS